MNHQEILACLEGCRLPEWETLPDFGLYMDQMLGLVTRSLISVGPRVDLTASMVNNYVKAGIMEKPVGKKYSRTALAQLLMIVQLKVTSPMDLLKTLLHPEDGSDAETIYRQFCQEQERIIETYRKQEDATPVSYALQASSLRLILRLSLE